MEFHYIRWNEVINASIHWKVSNLHCIQKSERTEDPSQYRPLTCVPTL